MAISLEGVVWLVVFLVVAAVIFGLLDYLIRTAPFVQEAWKPTLRWALVALGVLVLIGLLLSFLNGRPIFVRG
jgi:membrane associated rhomboid family serine protease